MPAESGQSKSALPRSEAERAEMERVAFGKPQGREGEMAAARAREKLYGDGVAEPGVVVSVGDETDELAEHASHSVVAGSTIHARKSTWIALLVAEGVLALALIALVAVFNQTDFVLATFPSLPWQIVPQRVPAFSLVALASAVSVVLAAARVNRIEAPRAKAFALGLGLVLTVGALLEVVFGLLS